MRIRSAGAMALHLVLLLASLFEAAGHELLCREAGTFSGAGGDLPALWAQIDPGGEELEDDCPCCGLCGPRMSLGPSSATNLTLEAAKVQVYGRSAHFIKGLSASHLSRGPPVC